ncbi:hypothetical protein VTI74DRAFT_2452 [Chaetomium olivicolor]
MTEIAEYLDLFWRNDINPEKVTLGLAFYSCTFLTAGPGYTEDIFKLNTYAARKLAGGATAVVAAAGTGTGGSSKKRPDTVIYETRYSKQLHRATYHELPKAVEIMPGLRMKFAISLKNYAHRPDIHRDAGLLPQQRCDD